MFLIVSRIAQRGEVHHRVAHVRVLEVEQPGDAAVLEHELERVVRDEPRRGEPVLRHVARAATGGGTPRSDRPAGCSINGS